MSRWTSQEILEALSGLDEARLDDDFLDLRTDEYRLIRYPQHLLSPTLPAAQVVWSNTSRLLDLVFSEVSSQVANWDLDAIHWWVSNGTLPLETEAYLISHGGTITDTYWVLARDLDEDIVAQRRRSINIDVKLVDDEAKLRDAIALETVGWGRTAPDEVTIDISLRETLRNLDNSSEFQFLAYLDGHPASTGYCQITGEIARLYGGVTLPQFRSQGCYQAVLFNRLHQARVLGAKIAITRGRPSTSGHILVDAGFSVHNIENCYRMPIC
ncbi:hypothetical protein [Acidithrix sp. C25]|uniref:hypothetical protein n=1 Tax=Acidithrix sp. C25 TaxID=1671482 RepID=UPI00191BB39B|nr:hypothetical protein [Acidithrix sp. C25]CAG4911177.1 unnamed protein product [Acidithrix sp. C25]